MPNLVGYKNKTCLFPITPDSKNFIKQEITLVQDFKSKELRVSCGISVPDLKGETVRRLC